MILNRRFTQSTVLHRHRLISLWPWGSSVAKKLQRLIGAGAELEAPSRGDDQGVAKFYVHRWNSHRLGIWRTAPDHSGALQDVPDFFNRAVPNRACDSAGTESNFNQTTFGPALATAHQQPNLRAVRSGHIGSLAAVSQWWDRVVVRCGNVSHLISGLAQGVRLSPTILQ